MSRKSDSKFGTIRCTVSPPPKIVKGVTSVPVFIGRSADWKEFLQVTQTVLSKEPREAQQDALRSSAEKDIHVVNSGDIEAKETTLNWSDLVLRVQNRVPGGRIPSPLFSVEIVDLDDDAFLHTYLPRYNIPVLDILQIEREADESIDYDGWRRWACDNKPKPKPKPKQNPKPRSLHASTSMLREQTWVDWFSTSIDQWIRLGDQLTILADGIDTPNSTLDFHMCAPLEAALMRHGLTLQWINNARAAEHAMEHDMEATSEEGDGARSFAAAEREWADAAATSATLPEVGVFFLKSSVGRTSDEAQQRLDGVKVVRMAAWAVWRALQNVPACKRGEGLGCVCAHLYEVEERSFTMDVYYVAYNAKHGCFQSQRIVQFAVPTDCIQPYNRILAVEALACYRTTALFVRKQAERWFDAQQAKPSMDSPGRQNGDAGERGGPGPRPDRPVPPCAFAPGDGGMIALLKEGLGGQIADLVVETVGLRSVKFSGILGCRQAVSLKVQENGDHARELSALWSLQGVSAVPQVLFSFAIDTRRMALVYVRLQDVVYDEMRRCDSVQCGRFVDTACEILASMHSRHVYHRSIQPSAFKVTDRGDYILTDFSHAHVGHARPPFLSGDPRFVFPGTPLERAEQSDCVGLGGVLGWILRIRGFGCVGTTYMDALREAQAARESTEMRKRTWETVRMLLDAQVSAAQVLACRKGA